MFALSAWCQVTYKQAQEKKTRRVEVFTRLGSKFVGWVTINEEKCTTLIRRVKDLQTQVARIFRHPTRTSNYLKLFVDNFELPSYTYHTKCCFDIEVKATFKLLGPHAFERLECMYSEDDDQTLKKLARLHPGIDRTPPTIYTFGDLVPYLRVLQYTHDPKQFEVINKWFPSRDCADLSVLASFTNLRELALRGICVESWEFAKHLPLKRLTLHGCDFPSLEHRCFSSLEELHVYLDDLDKFVLHERLGNLKSIKFFGQAKPSRETLRLLSTSFPDIHIEDWTERV